jgi:hypothetical protein
MKKIPDFWWTRNIIFVIVETVHWIRSRAKRIQSRPTPHLMSSAHSTFSAHLIFIYLTIIIITIIIIVSEEHKLWRSSLCNRSDYIFCRNQLIPYNIVLCEKISVTYHVTNCPTLTQLDSSLKSSQVSNITLYPAHALSHSYISSAGVATGYDLDGRGSFPGSSKRLFSVPQCSDWFWCPLSSLSSGYRGNL